MPPSKKKSVSRTSRRAFLHGQSALEAVRDLTAGQLPDSNAEPTVDTQDPERYLLHITRPAMACQFAVYLNAGQDAHGTEHALAALDLVEQLEAQLSVYRENSELSQINLTAANRSVVVEFELFRLLKKAVQMSRDTSGAFDITSGPLSKTWGFHARVGRLPSTADLARARQSVGHHHLVLDESRQTVRFDRAGVELNLGAIGKGHALDRCGKLMVTRGVRDYLLHGGQSSILAGGSRSGHAKAGWPIAVRHPLRPDEQLARVVLRDRALGTSGIMHQHFQLGGRPLGHILDPRSGHPIEGILACTVLADSAAEADALATAFFVMGPDEAATYCETHPEIDALFVHPGADDVSVVAIGAKPDVWIRA